MHRTYLFADRAIRDWGIGSHARLLAAGVSEVSIDVALMYGTIRRICRGWYASVDASPLAVRARQAGGRLACVSALEYHGVGPPSNTQRSIHIDLPRSSRGPRGSTGTRSDVIVHWSRTLGGCRQ